MEELKTTTTMLHLKTIEVEFRKKKSKQPKKFH